ncbi:TIGR03016 family PEP-CTERM system-associated outer membrane protein [Alteromonas sp. ASW11-19]|uniref:TIGR03016 family PEP-CTERM system-associated outer membrane protein n=1 Tax=Alteromonas salexigens TaxID=2982530 RepID=A0ABT2VQN0_9ALTE|nr:TIGR03016 family PEP-CTERM system-associated outer membrane protein [Alteromonas salexigens]MCU7555612.1 TIGR03016 family PEP-CTERM system-associated outer membrane protein [Alteromonas salexigens]
MAITTQREKANLMAVERRYLLGCSVLIGTCLLPIKLALANDLNLALQVETEAVTQEVQAKDRGSRSVDSWSVNPVVSAYYESRTISALWSGNVTYIDRSTDDLGDSDDTYEEYQYNAQWTPIERFLSFRASGALNYQNTDGANYLLSDYFTDPDALAKTRSNRLASTLQFTQGDYVRGRGTVSYAVVESEASPVTNNLALDNETYSTIGELRNGDEVTNLIWSLEGSYDKTERSTSSLGDFITRGAEAKIDAMLISDFGIRLSARHNADQVLGRNDSISNTRAYDSYGVGLTYRQAAGRFVSFTINQGKANDDEDYQTFVGAEMRWAFTPRTSLSAQYGRRYWGEKATVKFRYNTKHIRSSLSYDESVTSTSRLLANPENLGVFVCNIGQADLSSCYQPNSLSYVPKEGEQLVQFSTSNFEIDDDIILRKATNWQIGYEFSRIKLGSNIRYSLDDYLDEDRMRRTYSVSFDMVYRLGSYTRLVSDISYANIEQRSIEFQSGASENWNGSVGLTREIGQHFEAKVASSYIDKSGDLTTGNLGRNYSERRISLSLTYRYE